MKGVLKMNPRGTIVLSPVGQITIPRSVRRLLGIEKGSKLDYEINEERRTITLKKQPTVDEVFAELEKLSKECPKPDPRSKDMTVSEMVAEELEKNPLENDTWV